MPAERDGALVTVFLPGSGRPRPGFAAAALPLEARGRLTVTAGVRREVGIPDGADVFAVLDPDRATVTLTAASRLSAGIAGLLAGCAAPPSPQPRQTSTVPRRPPSPRARLPRTPPTPHDRRRRDRRQRATAHRPLARISPASAARPAPQPRTENHP